MKSFDSVTRDWRGYPRTAEAFWARVEKSADGCWLWSGTVDREGYGKVSDPVGRGTIGAHRASWFWTHGELPEEGLHLDHLCKVRNCVRPDHLEPVTPGENVRRGESPNMLAHLEGRCVRGHDAAESYRRRSTGMVVYCRACRREQRRFQAQVAS